MNARLTIACAYEYDCACSLCLSHAPLVFLTFSCLIQTIKILNLFRWNCFMQGMLTTTIRIILRYCNMWIDYQQQFEINNKFQVKWNLHFSPDELTELFYIWTVFWLFLFLSYHAQSNIFPLFWMVKKNNIQTNGDKIVIVKFGKNNHTNFDFEDLTIFFLPLLFFNRYFS